MSVSARSLVRKKVTSGEWRVASEFVIARIASAILGRSIYPPRKRGRRIALKFASQIQAITVFIFLTWTPALAGDNAFLTPEQLSPHRETIARVEKYLSALTTVAADFTQTAPDGAIATGKFYLKRPGRMRWQYDPPVPVLMVADGHSLVYYDSELQQVSYYPLGSTLAGFLAQDAIRLDEKVGIQEIEAKDNVIRIALAQRDKPDDGRLVLELSDKPLLIRNMIITDATRQTTTVSLNHARFGLALEKSLFVFNDPRPKRMN